MLDGQSVLLDRVDEVKDMISQDRHESEKDADVEDGSNSRPLMQNINSRRRLVQAPWSSGSNWAALGINGSLIPTEYGRYWDFCLAMQLCMPVCQYFVPYAFLLSVSVRTFPLCPYRFKFLKGGNIGFARLLADDHPFIDACESGNTEVVRAMLRSREGRADDIVARNWHPLAVSRF